MSPAEQVEFAWKHREHFAAVRDHNAEVCRRRLLGGSWDAPENQYRNAWRELGAYDVPRHPSPEARNPEAPGEAPQDRAAA